MVDCSRCNKPESLCVCADLRALSTRLHVLILQHPQEPDQERGTAAIAHLALSNSTLKVGLSWPNLRAALSSLPPSVSITPSRWAVLYWGSGLKLPEGTPIQAGLHFVDRKGQPLPHPPTPQEIEGLVVLDGTWSQAKALWWRNPWLIKLKRGVLVPSRPSLYGALRREPRRECLSTIEAISESLAALGESENTSRELRALFEKFVGKLKTYRRSRPGPTRSA